MKDCKNCEQNPEQCKNKTCPCHNFGVKQDNKNKWEYKLRKGNEIKIRELDLELQRQGQKGWELVTIYNNIYFFKRLTN